MNQSPHPRTSVSRKRSDAAGRSAVDTDPSGPYWLVSQVLRPDRRRQVLRKPPVLTAGLTPREPTYECVHVSVCACTHACPHTYLCLCVHTHLYVHACVHTCLCASCMCMCMCTQCAHVYMRAHLCVSTCVCTCLCVRVCTHVHVCESVCWGQVCLQAEQRCHFLRTLPPRPDRTTASQMAAVRQRHEPVSELGGCGCHRLSAGLQVRDSERGVKRGGAHTRFSTSSIEDLSDVFSCLCGRGGGDAVRPAAPDGTHAPGQCPAACSAGSASPTAQPASAGSCGRTGGRGARHLRWQHGLPALPLWARSAHVPHVPASSLSDVAAHGKGAGTSTRQRVPGAPRPPATPTRLSAGPVQLSRVRAPR